MTVKFHDKKLLEAVKSKQVIAAKSFLASGANPNLMDPASLNPIIYLALVEGQYDLLKSLLNAGANVSSKDREGRSLIRYAVEEGDLDAVKILVSYRANLNEVNEKRDSLLHSSCFRGRRGMNYFDITKFLIDAGLQTTVKNERGELPLHHAARYGGARMTKYLASKGDTMTIDIDGHTPLHAATMGIDNVDGVQALLDCKVEVNIQDRQGLTPLHNIAAKSKTKPADIQVAKLLIQAGANLWLRDSEGLTAYDMAVSAFEQRRDVHSDLKALLKPKGDEPPVILLDHKKGKR